MSTELKSLKMAPSPILGAGQSLVPALPDAEVRQQARYAGWLPVAPEARWLANSHWQRRLMKLHGMRTVAMRSWL